MEKYYIATGKTIDLAIQAGLNALGMDRDSVSVEVLENAKTGFLGIGASPAKVKVTYEVPDEVKPTPALSAASRSRLKKKDAAESAAPKVVDLPKASPKPTPKPQEQKPAPAKPAQKAQTPKAAAKPQEAKPAPKAQEAKPAPKAQEPKPKAAESQSTPAPAQSNAGKGTPRRSNDRRRQSKPKPDTAPQTAAAPKPEKPKAAPIAYTPAAPGSTEERIEQFIQGLLQHMGSQAVPYAVKTEEDTYHVELVGENLGMLIGRRGDTLDAIQHLTNYAINRDAAKRARITVDAESYREKREEALKRLAQKVAGKVVRYRHNITLEPMNAYERHVIHAELQDVSEVFTFSTGTEPNRRVVVSYNRNQKESNTQ